ncbi:MAG: hypothetical protein FJ299_09050 [Planctomycetes bacterium]|nr:hypothetical protein [Planctomycetota bacterium]
MDLITRLRGPIGCRLLIVYRIDLRALAALLPDELEPAPFKGYGLAALVYTHRIRASGRWWQAPPSQGGDFLTLRFTALAKTGAPKRAAVWIPRRETSSSLSARMASLLLPGEHQRCEVVLEQTDCTLELRVQSTRGEELYLRAGLACELRGSLFAHARELEHWLAEPRVVRPKSPFEALGPDFDRSALASGRLAAEPIEVRELRAHPFDDAQVFAPGTAELDSCWRLVPARGAREPLPARLDALRGVIGAPASTPPA